MLTILASGIYMMATAWGGVAWIIVVLGALVLVIMLSVVLTGRRMAPIGRLIAKEKGLVSPTLRSLVTHPLLWISMQTRLAIALGIVFLMTAKPNLDGSLLAIGIMVVSGLAISLPTRHMPAQEGQATDLK